MEIEEFDDLQQWAMQQWGQANLGDARRNARAIRLGVALAAQPQASLPNQTGSWAFLKAAYRLLNEKDVTYSALSAPHWQTTRTQASVLGDNVVLFIQDTTELDFTAHRQTQGLGHIGDTNGRGFELHSSLAVIPTPGNPEVFGVAAQTVWTREQVHKNKETRSQRHNRHKESDVWAEIVEAIGKAPSPETGTTWISVGDRGSDVFSYLRRSRCLDWHCLVRISQNRVIQTAAGHSAKLLSWARSLLPQATKTIELRGRDGMPKRTVELQVAWEQVSICPPRNGPERQENSVGGWCIRCWEPNVGKDALEWILFSTVPVTDAHSAAIILDWYACRWVIEEDHKCLKTGCSIEQRQLETAQGLLAILGFLAIVAVRLLQLRTLSRSIPESPASQVVPPLLLKVLVARLGLPNSELTMHQFWRQLASLGGFIGRKGDGEPGWQTLWRGWQRLQDLSWGAALAAPG